MGGGGTERPGGGARWIPSRTVLHCGSVLFSSYNCLLRCLPGRSWLCVGVRGEGVGVGVTMCDLVMSHNHSNFIEASYVFGKASTSESGD